MTVEAEADAPDDAGLRPVLGDDAGRLSTIFAGSEQVAGDNTARQSVVVGRQSPPVGGDG
jgi:hypothetical protein